MSPLPPRRWTWGAEAHADGSASFRLWAPACDRLALRIAGRDLPMLKSADGWFELAAPGAAADTEYAFVLPNGLVVPDPTSRRQAGSVHDASVLSDPAAYHWQAAEWAGRPWEEAILYEMHIGAFTPEGTFRSAIEKLPRLADLGVTALEIMPVAQFTGARGWGYDGVLPYAPHPAYGTPDDMRAFIDAAHVHGLMVLLDVVYNHFGPDGNYLAAYAPNFFDAGRTTPWGPAIAYHRPPVRRFFIENALYWLSEFRLDGLRLDAIDHVRDDKSDPELLVEIARAVRAETLGRPIHLTTEDNRNVAFLHARGPAGELHGYTAEWNDDWHNAAHVMATGETEGYYADFADAPLTLFARCLAEGFAYQGEHSAFAGAARGEPSTHLPPTAFIGFLQNHDQIGNRAMGERLTSVADPLRLRMLTAILLLSPQIPLLFMGEEHGERRPFLFFTDFTGDLADAVRNGRRAEFANFGGFSAEDVPDPNAEATFAVSKIDWERADSGEARMEFEFLRDLLALRRRHVVPLLATATDSGGKVMSARDGLLHVEWSFPAGRLALIANFSGETRAAVIDDALVTVFTLGLGPLHARDTLPAGAMIFAAGDGEQNAAAAV